MILERLLYLGLDWCSIFCWDSFKSILNF